MESAESFQAIFPESLDDYPLRKQQRNQWTLPKGLGEVSGVAVVDADRIFIHQDESAIVYEFRFSTLEVTTRFQLGDPVLELDVEGIALIESDVFLMLSSGHIYKITDGISRRGVIEDFEIYDTGMEKLCEVESLDEDIRRGSLVFACKRLYEENSPYISVYRYTPGDDKSVKLFDLPFESLGGKFHPSAIATQFGGYILLAAKERLVQQVSMQGEVMSSVRLKKKHHPQAEGLGFLPDGRLVIADEGRHRKGRISVYHPIKGS